MKNTSAEILVVNRTAQSTRPNRGSFTRIIRSLEDRIDLPISLSSESRHQIAGSEATYKALLSFVKGSVKHPSLTESMTDEVLRNITRSPELLELLSLMRSDSLTFFNDKLPWTGKSIPWADIGPLLAKQLPEEHPYLSQSVSLYWDSEDPEGEAVEFINQMVSTLKAEFVRRRTREKRFIELGLFTQEELYRCLTVNTAAQPWILYYSPEGGLHDNELAPGKEVDSLAPCSSMRNHGVVAWHHDDAITSALVTAPKEGGAWDWDSDICHESAHVASPVPYWIQDIGGIEVAKDLPRVKKATDLTRDQLKWMTYWQCEFAVVSVRGEARDTETGLPFPGTPKQLKSMLKLCHQLMPPLRFDHAFKAYKAIRGKLDIDDPVFYMIGASALRFTSSILPNILNAAEPPSPEYFIGNDY